jgi:hypothetical protein
LFEPLAILAAALVREAADAVLAQEDLSTPSGSSAGNLAVAARIVAETFESLGMKFPEPTVNIKEIARK